MSKRFTDTNKYKKPFIRGLKGPYKLFWDYLYHDCDHAGIWIVDFEIAQVYLGEDMPINKKDALHYFNNGENKIIEIDGGKKWFIPSFVEFQYGKLNENNRVHNSVINALKKYNVFDKQKRQNKPLISPLQGAMDKDKEEGLLRKEQNTNKLLIEKIQILPEYKETFLLWLDYKKKRKESYKDITSTTLAYKKLLRLSEHDPKKAVKIVENSMANNWAGLFELDMKNKTNNKPIYQCPVKGWKFGESFNDSKQGCKDCEENNKFLFLKCKTAFNNR